MSFCKRLQVPIAISRYRNLFCCIARREMSFAYRGCGVSRSLVCLVWVKEYKGEGWYVGPMKFCAHHSACPFHAEHMIGGRGRKGAVLTMKNREYGDVLRHKLEYGVIARYAEVLMQLGWKDVNEVIIAEVCLNCRRGVAVISSWKIALLLSCCGGVGACGSERLGVNKGEYEVRAGLRGI